MIPDIQRCPFNISVDFHVQMSLSSSHEGKVSQKSRNRYQESTLRLSKTENKLDLLLKHQTKLSPKKTATDRNRFFYQKAKIEVKHKMMSGK